MSLASLYAPNGWFGAPLAALGIKVAFTPLGILVALIFVGLPFVVRTVQPMIGELEIELEEASATLGATRRRPSGACSAAAGAGAFDRLRHGLRARASANTAR